LPFDPRQVGARFGEHFGRTVDADDLCGGPAFGDKARHIAGAAAEIVDEPRRLRLDMAEQIDRGAQARAGEF